MKLLGSKLTALYAMSALAFHNPMDFVYENPYANMLSKPYATGKDYTGNNVSRNKKKTKKQIKARNKSMRAKQARKLNR